MRELRETEPYDLDRTEMTSGRRLRGLGGLRGARVSERSKLWKGDL